MNPGVHSVAVIGAGKMGETMLSGLLRASWPADALLASVRREERAEQLRERYGVRVLPAREAAEAAEVVVIGVKPQDAGALLNELNGVIPEGRLLISLCAGLPTAYFEQRFPHRTPVVRVMSNTPALVDQAMSALSAGAHADSAHLALTEELLEPLGKTLRVPESQLDAVTALSGSGPAYVYYLVEAMTDAGILLGLPRQVAHDLIVQAVVGAAAMLQDTGEHPVALREAVTSPGGTTINAIRELENHRVRAAVLDAIEAARDRARELAATAGSQ